jgi:hypothetical protein
MKGQSMKKMVSLIMLSFCVGGLSSCSSLAETPGERFRKAIKEIEAACAKRKLDPNEVCGGVARLKAADPLATEEGRFAHSIKIPNPVPDDSGYKPTMTPQEYFDHLCKSEAGEFIYKTVDGVKGFYLMRTRKKVTDSELEHLYALEAPYQEIYGEYDSPGEYFVQPYMGKYELLEIPLHAEGSVSERAKFRRYYRDESAYPGRQYQTAINGKAVFVPYVLADALTSSLESRYGVTWRGIPRFQDRELGIAGSELIIFDLSNKEVLAVRRGFKRTGGVRNLTGVWWLTGQTCPKVSDKPDNWFIRDVLKPFDDSKTEEK